MQARFPQHVGRNWQACAGLACWLDMPQRRSVAPTLPRPSTSANTRPSARLSESPSNSTSVKVSSREVAPARPSRAAAHVRPSAVVAGTAPWQEITPRPPAVGRCRRRFIGGRQAQPDGRWARRVQWRRERRRRPLAGARQQQRVHPVRGRAPTFFVRGAAIGSPGGWNEQGAEERCEPRGPRQTGASTPTTQHGHSGVEQ